MMDFEQYYNKNFERYKKYATSRIKRIDIAEDITQDAFIKLNESMGTIEETKYDSWLMVVIKNKAVDFFRKKSTMYESPLHNHPHVDMPDDGNNILMQMEANDTERQIRNEYNKVIQVAQELSPIYKKVFMMYELENMPHALIAKELGITIGASKSNLHKARKNIRERINNE